MFSGTTVATRVVYNDTLFADETFLSFNDGDVNFRFIKALRRWRKRLPCAGFLRLEGRPARGPDVVCDILDEPHFETDPQRQAPGFQ